MSKENLDVKTLKTVEDLNKTDFSKFADSTHKSWVRHIVYPIGQAELNRICDLSFETNSKVKLANSMGDLYYEQSAKA